MIRSHTFRGKRWRIKYRRMKEYSGSCDPPTEPEKVIMVHPQLEGLDELDTWIHEALHATVWDLDEEAVNESARDIARLLWRLGYRRTT